MQIIEQNLIGKHTEADCEDGIVITKDFVAVIDGSTSKTSRRIHADRTNGQYCMMLIAEMVRSMAPDISLDEFCNAITARIRQQYSPDHSCKADQEPSLAYIPPAERLCASAVIYSRAHRQIWMIGDCQCMVDGRLYDNPKPYEAPIASHRAAIFARKAEEHPDMIVDGQLIHDYARDEILPMLIESMNGQNKDYAIIDGYPIHRAGIRVVDVDACATELVLASDGYPFLRPTLRESEEALARQLRDDPYNILSFKATKGSMAGNRSFDDRAYVRVTSEE
ncbi:MAG: hypothetical protein I3J02_00400 [Prevotella sp.]|nr:hypothetical protein [Prevotella sp.]